MNKILLSLIWFVIGLLIGRYMEYLINLGNAFIEDMKRIKGNNQKGGKENVWEEERR